jgi:hypothetical protein
MTASLRPFIRSRGLRAMGALAWLMLVITSLAAAPLDMGRAHAHAMDGLTAAVGEPLHHQGQSQAPSHDCCAQHDGCCGHQAGHACGCVGMCASAVPPTPASLIAAWTGRSLYDRAMRVHAPSVVAAPPLRPPSV